jgi:formylglycine-generating enzyme required for sulfatase activity
MTRRNQAFGWAGLAGLTLIFAGLPTAPANSPPPAAHKNYTETIKGSPASEAGRQANEGPQHKVKIPAFWMAKTEVTWDEFRPYQKVLLDIDSGNREKAEFDAVTYPTKPYVPADYGHGYEGKPAICMTHHCAMEYCRWLSLKTGKTYRLPTEAEWEYACRAGTDTAYHFGNDPAQLKDYAWFKDNSPTADIPDGTTHKVASKKPNPWGLFDLYGNVAEWTLDQYDKGRYERLAKQPLSLAPVLLPNANKWAHVTRGGHWKDASDALRSASRRHSDPKWMKHDPQEPRSIWWLTKQDIIGFRVVRAVEEQADLKDLKSKVTIESDDSLDDK